MNKFWLFSDNGQYYNQFRHFENVEDRLDYENKNEGWADSRGPRWVNIDWGDLPSYEQLLYILYDANCPDPVRDIISSVLIEKDTRYSELGDRYDELEIRWEELRDELEDRNEFRPIPAADPIAIDMDIPIEMD